MVGECELGGLLLQFGEFVLVFGHLFQRGLDELALHVTERDGELVDLDLVCKGKLGSLLMQLGELVVVLEDLLKGGLYELSSLPLT